jgi:hypothetical protein
MLGVAVKLERRRIAERTARRRRADAKPKGVKFGRKPTLTPHRQREARERLDAGETQRSVPAATTSAKGRFRDCVDEALHQLDLVSGATPTYPSFKRSRTVSLSEFLWRKSSIPLDIPMDELVTWKQLTGDRRLSDALAECDSGGGTRCLWRPKS